MIFMFRVFRRKFQLKQLKMIILFTCLIYEIMSKFKITIQMINKQSIGISITVQSRYSELFGQQEKVHYIDIVHYIYDRRVA